MLAYDRRQPSYKEAASTSDVQYGPTTLYRSIFPVRECGGATYRQPHSRGTRGELFCCSPRSVRRASGIGAALSAKPCGTKIRSNRRIVYGTKRTACAGLRLAVRSAVRRDASKPLV